MAEIGTFGWNAAYRNDPAKGSGTFGFYAAYRESSDAPGTLGFYAGYDGNIIFNIFIANASSLLAVLPTITISWVGQTAETHIYNSSFVANRQLPVNVTVTIAVSGTGYLPSSVVFTPTNARQTIAVPITLISSVNAYQRRRYL